MSKDVSRLSILIAGYGIVGKNIHKFLLSRKDYVDMEIVTYDIDKTSGADVTHVENHFDYAFICVDTPMKSNGEADMSQVINVLTTLRDKVDMFILKSTIPVGSTRWLHDMLNIDIVFSPEYFGRTVHANLNTQAFEILGGPSKTVNKIASLYQKLYTGATQFFYVSYEEAEMVKYMENSFLATKVTFCNDFYRLCEALENVEYNKVREMFVADSRVNPSHTFIYPETPYYNSHCLNKDVPAIVSTAKELGINTLLDQVVKLNDLRKKENSLHI